MFTVCSYSDTLSLIETCKLNAVDPLAYLTKTPTFIGNGRKQSQIEGILPWNYEAGKFTKASVIRNRSKT